MEQVKTKQKKKKDKEKFSYVTNYTAENSNKRISSSPTTESVNDTLKKTSDLKLPISKPENSKYKKISESDDYDTLENDDYCMEANESLEIFSLTTTNSTCDSNSSAYLDVSTDAVPITEEEIIEKSSNTETSPSVKNEEQSTSKAENTSATKIAEVIQAVRTEEKPSAPNYTELSALVKDLHKIEINSEKTVVTVKTAPRELQPFTFEEIENIFGIKEVVRARMFAAEFEKFELQSPANTNPLFEALTEYQRARSRLIANEKKIETLLKEYKEIQNNVWVVKECTKTSGAKCEDGFYYTKSYNFTDANFQESIFTDLQNCLGTLRNNSGDTHSLFSHTEYFQKIQIDELIWDSIVNGLHKMKESLRILFWVLRTSGWGYDKLLRKQLRNWCSLLASALLNKDNSLINTLFILHHILRVPQGIRWALHLVQCNMNSVSEVENALCLLETILISSKFDSTQQNQQPESPTNGKSFIDENELVVAQEADESLWTLVDSDGEGADFDTHGLDKKIALKESDIVGLVKQIPFKKIFRELMLVRNNGNEDIFCGGNLSGGSILKVFSATRLLLKIIRSGLLSYKNYLELSKELCRLALHSVMYCTDLWESASSRCEANLIERLSTEYNNVFWAGWSTIKSAGTKDISFMFLSEMPFKLCQSETISTLCKSLTDSLVVSDDVKCYYILVTISNMAIARTEKEFVISIVKTLFEIGFLSEFSEFSCGEWARTLCGAVLHVAPQYIGFVLNLMPPKVSSQWFDDLPLNLWRPMSDELLNVLFSWRDTKMNMLPFLLKSLDWKCTGGLPLHDQRDVAIFLCTLAQQLTQPKKPPPEWIWECILFLKLHHIEWEIDITTAPKPENLCGLDISGKCQITNFTLILMTSWGHSCNSIFQQAAPLLIKLANSGRFTEVIHVTYYIIPIISTSPDFIGQCKIFKELLYIIIQAEKSYTKLASRLVNNDFPGPMIKLFADMIRFQLKNCKKLKMTSINNLVTVWIKWLTSQENWQSDSIVVYLLDVVLGCCFLNYDCMVEAADVFKKFIQVPSSPKSPTSSGFSSWLWNSSSSFKGLIQCAIEAPFLSHVILWIEHTNVERQTGLWQKLIEKLALQSESTKVNIDKTLKAVGGNDSANYLVIYRSLQCAMTTSASHPIATLLWQLFFYLYLDTSFSTVTQSKPVGPLFFQGLINSRVLAKAKARLLEVKAYHESKVKEFTDNDDVKNIVEQITYHTEQAQLMNTFHTWLNENFFQDFGSSKTNMYSDPNYSKMCSLIAGYTNTWTDTINRVELKKLQGSSYYLSLYGNIDNIEISAEPPYNKSDTSKLSPGEKILQRLKTYEDPISKPLEKFEYSKLVSIIDPLIFKDSSTVYNKMKSYLEEIKKLSRKFSSISEKINTVDGNFYQLLPVLYEEKRFLQTYSQTCGATCTKSAKISLQGTESILKDNVNNSITLNRKVHETLIAEIMEPYKELAINTAVISKLAQLACNGSILNSDNSIALFNIIMSALNEDVPKLLPAKQILNTIATQLGEKFISRNGRQCIVLINNYKDMENMNLICSLLQPLQLSPSEMSNLYETISLTIPNIHVTFSCLSKFPIPIWLKSVRPAVMDRSKLLMHICNALGVAGCDPPPERAILKELLCVHLTQILSWEFPVLLNQVLLTFCNLSLEKKLPPDCWEHCITVIETYPHKVLHGQANSSMDAIGRLWWTKRSNNGPSTLYNTYNIYINYIARIGAILTSTIISSAMLHQPLLLTHQISSIVFSAMSSYWSVWLVPWWGGTTSILYVDIRYSVILPWSLNDVSGPETMLDAFVETISYCIHSLPGSANDFLRLTWQWYVNNFVHMSVSPHVLLKVHKALARLPWSAVPDHWITFTDFQIMSKMCYLNLPSCHSFMLECLGNRTWQPWINALPIELQVDTLSLLFPIIFKLHPEKHIILDAASLPWHILKTDKFEDHLNSYMLSFNNFSKPFYSDEVFPLICSMAGLKIQGDYSQDWQLKRISLIRAWVNSFATYSQAIVDVKQKAKLNDSISSSTSDLLNKIESVVLNLVGANDTQKLLECSHLLNTAIVMLNTSTLQEITMKVWIDWVTNASNISIVSLVSCILNVTQRNIFGNLAEHTLLAYFQNKGNWLFIRDTWKNNCTIPIEFLISNNFLITAMGTYASIDFTKSEGTTYEQIHKRIIQALHTLTPTCNTEKKCCLWICYMISLLSNLSLSEEEFKSASNDFITILMKWSQEPSWEIFKAIRLVQDISPTIKFRIITKFVYCVMTDFCDKMYGNEAADYLKDSSYCKISSSFEAMTEQKQCFEIKHVLAKYIEYSKDRNNCRQNILKRVTDICSELYPDANYVISLYTLLKV